MTRVKSCARKIVRGKGIIIYRIFEMGKRIKKFFLLAMIFILTAMILTACGKGKFVLPGQPQANPGDVLFEDDFSETSTGWGTMEKAGGEIEPNYGGLVFSVYLPNFMFWSVNGGDFADVRINVDAVLMEGPVNDNFGVICRYQDEENYYGFLLSHDGYYGIFKYINGNMVTASEEGNLAYSEAIRQGGVVNHIEAICQGNTLSLSVNDTLLASVVDDSFTSGKIGLIAGAYDSPGVNVLFDNLKVYQP